MYKKTRIIIVSIIILVLAIVLCIKFSSKENEMFSFDQIMGGVNSNDIVRIEGDSGEESLDIIKQFDGGSFTRYDGKLGNTARRKLTLYDKNGDEIATITDIGNSGIIEVELTDSKQTYKMVEE